jgi:hypothetical protein
MISPEPSKWVDERERVEVDRQLKHLIVIGDPDSP